MDREVLYRGKRTDTGEWAQGYLVEQNTPEYHAYIITDFCAEVDDRHVDILECEIHEVDPETVGRNTGLTDRSGKWIFDGDIISIPWQNGVQFRVVRYKNGMFNAYTKTHNAFYCISLCSFVGFDDPENCCEVIGNIHDNPQLMEPDEGGENHGETR